jgi:hypothetical protein
MYEGMLLDSSSGKSLRGGSIGSSPYLDML